MIRKVTLNFLQHRRNYIDLLYFILNHLKPENKKQLKVNILLSKNLPEPSIKLDPLIEFASRRYYGDNYMNKVWDAVSEPSPYSIKMDEDLFFGWNVWDYIIENCHYLDDNPNVITLTGVLDIGIPGHDLFVKNFCTSEEQFHINSNLLKSPPIDAHCNQIWSTPLGLYSEIDNYLKTSKAWNSQEYYQLVRKINHMYKGVHPIRFSYDLQCYLFNLAVQNVDRLLRKQKYNIVKYDVPYMCDCMFTIKTHIWKDVITQYNITPFDEVELNKYREDRKMDFAFIENGFGLHTLYGEVSHVTPLNPTTKYHIEDQLYERLKEAIYNYDSAI